MRMLVIRDKNFMIQETEKTPNRIKIRIDDSDNHRTSATLLKTGETWAYSIEERRGYWSRGCNIGRAEAPDQDCAYQDMFYHIRCCNYSVEVS